MEIANTCGGHMWSFIVEFANNHRAINSIFMRLVSKVNYP